MTIYDWPFGALWSLLLKFAEYLPQSVIDVDPEAAVLPVGHAVHVAASLSK